MRQSVPSHPVPDLRPLAPGFVLALLAIAFGFLLGGSFGAVEDSIKSHLRSSADVVFATVYDGDAEKRDAVVSKSWAYLQRAHLHGGAIGAAALASITLLALFGSPGLLERGSALASGEATAAAPRPASPRGFSHPCPEE